VTSLRSRLILGTCLAAIIPLAVVTVILSRRIESMVRAQASDRLSAALGGLRAQLDADGQRIAGQLEILAADPLTKRLYLLRPVGTRDLADHLARQRTLLGVDFLQVEDTTGVRVSEASAGGDVVIGTISGSDSTGASASHGLATVQLDGHPALAMVARAIIPYEGESVGRLIGGERLDAAFLGRLKRTAGVDLILRDGEGAAIVATLAHADSTRALEGSVERSEIAGVRYLSRSLPLDPASPRGPAITGLVPTAASDRTIKALQWATLLLALIGLGIAVILGALWSSQLSRPVEQLAAYSHRLAQGEWDEPLALESVRELETLVVALDRMRTDLRSYRARLVTSERQAAWSQMARKVAHEVKNPLTPIAISVADLKRSYEQKRPDFPQILDQAVRTVGEEVESLKRMLNEFSEFARLPAPRMAPCRISDLLGELRTLYAREVECGRLAVPRPPREIEIQADAAQLRQAVINLVKNGLEAIPEGGRVTVTAAASGGALEIAVGDDGPGLRPEQRAQLFVPGFTTKAEGSGLGLTIVERIVNDHRGTIAVDAAGAGTTFRIRLPIRPEA
jgi:signal transduction histidine kinase